VRHGCLMRHGKLTRHGQDAELKGVLKKLEGLEKAAEKLETEEENEVRHICARTGLNSPTSAPGLGSTRPHLLQDWAQAAHICTRTGLTLPHLSRDWAHPRPHLHRDWAHPRPHLRRDWAEPCHICTSTGLTPAISALVLSLDSPLPHPHRTGGLACRRPCSPTSTTRSRTKS
jgi:hypothetical protein